MRNRLWRREQERKKADRIERDTTGARGFKYYHLPYPGKFSGKSCSNPRCCGNPRRWRSTPTMQEVKLDLRERVLDPWWVDSANDDRELDPAYGCGCNLCIRAYYRDYVEVDLDLYYQYVDQGPLRVTLLEAI